MIIMVRFEFEQEIDKVDEEMQKLHRKIVEEISQKSFSEGEKETLKMRLQEFEGMCSLMEETCKGALGILFKGKKPKDVMISGFAFNELNDIV